ncbi:uncharacterized protein LOC18435400 [Amborella trichopoda]|nr:uncharacterized protein LOC18435400 [Amborella trichopoda]|eukprot:XP_006845508.2 uncharacterized protein LOC18435400 [Amborella trichopoda]
MKNSTMADEKTEPLGILGILKEALKLPLKNKSLMVFVTIFTILPLSLLLLSHQLLLLPFAKVLLFHTTLLSRERENSKEALETMTQIRKDVRLIVAFEVAFLLLISIATIFSLATTIYTVATTYVGKHLTKKQLLSRVFATWMRPLLTWFFIFLLCVAFSVLLMLSLGVLSLFVGPKAIVGYSIAVSLMVLGVLIYLVTVWALAMVVSIVEDDCYGFDALCKASALIKGKRMQGYFLTLVLVVLGGFIGSLFRIDERGRKIGGQIAFSVILVIVSCLLKLYNYVAFTVFYFECKKWHGEAVMIEETGYTLVPVLNVNTA